MLEKRHWAYAGVVSFVLVALTYHKINEGQLQSSLRESPSVPRKLEAAAGSLPGVDLLKAKEATQNVLSLIKHRYQLDDMPGKNFFLTANNMGAEIWEIMKYKFASKVVEGNQNFLMIFAGSSVTAGHDSYFNQSYSSIVDQRLHEILRLLGIEMQVHNIAQGANNCLPYTFCYEAMGGMNPDFVNWEQSYNCGHDDRIYELAGRVAGYSSNRGVVYFSASGAWRPDSCPPSTDPVPYCSETWTPQSAGLSPWMPNPDDLSFHKHELDRFYKARPSASRFAGWMRSNPAYAGTGPHGFNVWEPNPLCETIKEGKEQKGCSGIEAAQGCAMKFMTHEAARYGSDDGGGANHHPSRAFHMLRGEAIVWNYALPLLDAIYMLESEITTRSKEEMLKDYKQKLEKLQPPLPGPWRCGDLHCEHRPVCFTDFRAHFPKNMTVSELIVGRTNWTYEREDLGEWSIHYGYSDAKPSWYAKGRDIGEIHVKVAVTAALDAVRMCGLGEAFKHIEIFADLNVPEMGNWSSYEPRTGRQLWTSFVHIGNDCVEMNKLPAGTHVLSLSTAETKRDHTSSLTHVITWPV